MPAAVLLDLDGTLYVGDHAVAGAAAALAALRARGIPFRAVSNTTSRSRAMLVERLAGFGLAVEPHEVFSAPLAARELCLARGHRRVAPFLPAPALADLGGLVLEGGVSGVPAAAPPDAVLLGDLGTGWSYALLQEAFTHVMAGAELLTCSRDRYFRRADGLALDAGPFVAALEYATRREAVVAGKPSASFFAGAVRSLGLPAGTPLRDVVMVGDDLWSDIEGAQGAGLAAWLVRTGKFRQDELDGAGIVPDRVIASVAELAA